MVCKTQDLEWLYRLYILERWLHYPQPFLVYGHNISSVVLVYLWKKKINYNFKGDYKNANKCKNQKQGRVASVIHGSSYSQVAVEQTDADGVATGSFIHAAIPVDICKKMELVKGNLVTCIFPAATVILAKHD